MTISLVLLTMNRSSVVQRSLSHNLSNAGHTIDEIVHVDNGSTDNVREVVKAFHPSCCVYFKENKGVAVGYNAGMLMARGDYILITGCDRFMPDGWLETLMQYQAMYGGIGCIYSKPIESVPERRWAKTSHRYAKLDFIDAMPMEARIFSRLYLKKFGYFREDFGLYGHEDLEWAERFKIRRLTESSYIIPGLIAKHEGSEGINEWDGIDEKEYHAMKRREALDPKKQEKLNWCREIGFPLYFPGD